MIDTPVELTQQFIGYIPVAQLMEFVECQGIDTSSIYPHEDDNG